MNSMARRMFELVEPIGVIPYSADEPNEAMFALGFTNYWDTYFAGRAAPLGLATAEVVDALFYNFAPGEVARHIPKVWRTTTPEAAIAARQAGCVKALRRILGDHVDSPGFARAAELLVRAATSAPFEGRPMYAALRAIDVDAGPSNCRDPSVQVDVLPGEPERFADSPPLQKEKRDNRAVTVSAGGGDQGPALQHCQRPSRCGRHLGRLDPPDWVVRDKAQLNCMVQDLSERLAVVSDGFRSQRFK
jgi:hypothetical protein